MKNSEEIKHPKWRQKRDRIRKRRVELLRKLKKSMGCVNCGYNKHGAALQFAHIDQMDKHAALAKEGSRFTSGRSTAYAGMDKFYTRISIKDREKNTKYIKELFDEIRKCRILCANCHAIETDTNKQYAGHELNIMRGGNGCVNKNGRAVTKYGFEERGDLQEFFVDSL